jgi:nucleoid-associated protein
MSLDIDQIALHQLIKRDEQNLELVLRDSYWSRMRRSWK